MSHSPYGTRFKFLLVLIAGLLWGLVLSIGGMFLVYRVDDWDDAPGGGIFALFAMFVGVAGGLAGGRILSESIWKNRDDHNQIQVWRTAKGSILLVCAIAIAPIVLIMPMSVSDLASRRVLSIGVAAALAVIDIALFVLSASYLGPQRSEQSEI